MPQRSITIYTGEENYSRIRTALEALADDVIGDEEAGQRGAKLSKLLNMIASAYIANSGETARLMKEIKSTLGGDQ
jgi:hypothetical protein